MELPADIREKAQSVFDALADDPEVWATHGLPQTSKEYRIVETIAHALLERDRAATERAAKIAEEVGAVQSDGWAKVPKPTGCGGAIAASNTGFMIAAAIRSQP